MIVRAYRAVQGRALDDCVVLADRFKDVWDEQYAESWILRRAGAAHQVLMVHHGWIRNLWLSPAGRVWAAQGDCYGSGVHVEVAPSRWQFHPLRVQVDGLWGLDDDHAFAWGGDVLFRWDGRGWSEIASPGRITAMDGTAPDLIFAAGLGGLLARWDGARWRRYACGAGGVSSVRVIGPDEIYACASPVLFAGTTRGFAPLVTSDLGPDLVAKRGGDVLVGLTPAGLARVDGGTLAPLPFEGTVLSIDARDRLLLARADALAESVDLAGFTTASLDEFRAQTRGVPPAW